jgi:hypothetical protein
MGVSPEQVREKMTGAETAAGLGHFTRSDEDKAGSCGELDEM